MELDSVTRAAALCDGVCASQFIIVPDALNGLTSALHSRTTMPGFLRSLQKASDYYLSFHSTEPQAVSDDQDQLKMSQLT